MNSIEYVKSEKIWRNTELDNEFSSLGEAILEKLNNADPEKVFEVLHDTGTHVTVKEILHQTISVAKNLLKAGVKKDDTILFFTMLNLKVTPLTFACYTIGAKVCFFETYLEEKLIPRYIEMLDPSVIIYEEKFKGMIFKALEMLNLTNVKHILSLDGAQNSVDELLFNPKVDIKNFQAPNIGDPKVQPAILAFTSGSTGLPKIVILSHEMMKQGVYGRWQAKPGSVVMILSEIRWICQVTAMMQPAFLDVKRVYSSTPPIELTGEFIREIIDSHKVTHYFEVPSVFRTLLEAAGSLKKPSSLSSLRLIMLGGESAGEDIEGHLQKIAPNCKIAKCYGLTETVGGIVSTELVSGRTVNGGLLRKGYMLKIIDGNANSLGPNEIGVICLKSTVPYLGYLKNKAADEETFIDGGWLNSRDLGMMDSDNLLNVLTREKYGLRYADGKILMPQVVENIICKFNGVHSSALIGNPSIENPRQDYGTIFVVLKNCSTSFNIEENLKNYLKKALTREQMKIVKYFKIMEALPMTHCCKLDRKALKGMFEGGKEI